MSGGQKVNGRDWERHPKPNSNPAVWSEDRTRDIARATESIQKAMDSMSPAVAATLTTIWSAPAFPPAYSSVNTTPWDLPPKPSKPKAISPTSEDIRIHRQNGRIIISDETNGYDMIVLTDAQASEMALLLFEQVQAREDVS